MLEKIQTAIAAAVSHAAGGIASALDGSGFIGELIRSESGRVNPEQGFRLAWAAGVIVAAMVVLGSPPKAVAHHSCGSSSSGCVSNGQCTMWCQIYQSCNYGQCRQVNNSKYCLCYK